MDNPIVNIFDIPPTRDEKPIIMEVTKDIVMLDNNSTGYDIPREQLSNPILLLGWIHHLCEKTWINKEAIEEILNFVKKEGKIKF